MCDCWCVLVWCLYKGASREGRATAAAKRLHLTGMKFHIIRIVLNVFLCLHFFCLSVYRGSWRMYVVPVIAQHTGMVLCYCFLPDTT